jgi:hypothetical protein
MTHFEKSVWDIFSKFIRARNANWQRYCKCIICSKTANWKTYDSGHYIAQSSDSALKFNEINNAQCFACNRMKSDNLIEYRQGLVRKYSKEKVKKLEQSHIFKTTKKKPN